MRKQYHFRKVDHDIHIWDVDHLVLLTQNLNIKQITLSEIQELNEAYWYPDTHPCTLDIIEHMQLILAADLSYPIILCAQGRLMDGMHRVAKAKLLGQHHISAVQFDKTPQADFMNVHEDDLIYDDE